MKNIFKYLLSGSLVVSLTACNEDDVTDQWLSDNPPAEEPAPATGDPGDLDLSNLVVLGTSLAGGLQDGALYNDGQANSFPALLGTQFQISGVGGTTSFDQPDIDSENGYHMILADGSGRTVLDLSLQLPVPTTGDVASILTPWGGTTSELNNFGVPLTQAVQLIIAATGGPVTETYGGGVPPAGNPAYNPFYRRFASNPSADGSTGSSPMTDALSAGGSFFIYEAGINDVGLYAAGGGTTALGPLTASGDFQNYAGVAINALASAGTTLTPADDEFTVEGVVLTVPPLLVFPFFQAVKWNAVALDEATATQLMTGLASVNGAIDGAVLAGYEGPVASRKINYAAGNNPILVVDASLEDLGPYWDALVGLEQMTPAQRMQLEPYRQSRPLVAGELVPLTTGLVLGDEADGDDTELNTPRGVVIPLGFDLGEYDLEPLAGDNYYLTLAEQGEIETVRAGYNTALNAIVTDINDNGGDVAVVDISGIFLDAAGLSDGEMGISVDGYTLSPDFAPNGIFSTDGLHPGQRGHGLVANTIINAINTRWGASIPLVNVIALSPPPFQP